MQKHLKKAVGTILVSMIIWASVSFQVYEGYQAIITRFGKPVKVITTPGLNWKRPWPFEKAYIVDCRKKVYDTRFAETLTLDKKNVILLTYVLWQIENPLKFLQAVGSQESAETKIDGMVLNAKNSVLGNYELKALVSTNLKDIKIAEIEKAIVAQIAPQIEREFGICIHQVGFKRIALPEANIEYVLAQMRAERAQFATRYRAEGEREASKIRSQTDLEKAQILARAHEDSARIRGEAEAETARIYSEAHSTDPEFYQFLRSLESLEKILKEKATVIIKTDTPPFDIFEKEAE